MKDNENVFTVFYGPMLLAFETNNELILKGTTDEILKLWIENENEMTFSLRNNKISYKLKPFYLVNTSSYGVYASICNEY